jgi:hypothetical protein
MRKRELPNFDWSRHRWLPQSQYQRHSLEVQASFYVGLTMGRHLLYAVQSEMS